MLSRFPRPAHPIPAIRPPINAPLDARPTPSVRPDTSAWLGAAARAPTARTVRRTMVVPRATAWTLCAAVSRAPVPVFRAPRPDQRAAANPSLRARPTPRARPATAPLAAGTAFAMALVRARFSRKTRCVARPLARACQRSRPERATAMALVGNPDLWTVRPSFAPTTRVVTFARPTRTARTDTSVCHKPSTG